MANTANANSEANAASPPETNQPGNMDNTPTPASPAATAMESAASPIPADIASVAASPISISSVPPNIVPGIVDPSAIVVAEEVDSNMAPNPAAPCAEEDPNSVTATLPAAVVVAVNPIEVAARPADVAATVVPAELPPVPADVAAIVEVAAPPTAAVLATAIDPPVVATRVTDVVTTVVPAEVLLLPADVATIVEAAVPPTAAVLAAAMDPPVVAATLPPEMAAVVVAPEVVPTAVAAVAVDDATPATAPPSDNATAPPTAAAPMAPAAAGFVELLSLTEAKKKGDDASTTSAFLSFPYNCNDRRLTVKGIRNAWVIGKCWIEVNTAMYP